MNRTILHLASRRRRAAQAFTLVEILMVVLILAITAMIVVPRAARSDTFEVQGAARAVVSDLMFAQNDAVSQQQVRKVVFDTVNNHYQITDSADTPLPAPWLGGSYQVDFGANSRFPSVQLANANFGGSATVTFDELGTPSSGGSVDVQIGTLVYRVSVTAFTGRVTVTQVGG
jgi:prepilin-type N-terminal cleavage/methylation domain-containing protein